jgi:phosphatidylserine decarboxylase
VENGEPDMMLMTGLFFICWAVAGMIAGSIGFYLDQRGG